MSTPPILDLFVNEIMERVNDDEQPLEPSKRKALISLISSIKQYIGNNPDIMDSKQKLEGLLELIIKGFRHSGYKTSEAIIQSFPVIVSKLDELIESKQEVVTEAVDLSKDSKNPKNVTGYTPQDQQLEIKIVNNEVTNGPVQKDDNVKIEHSPAHISFSQILKQYPILEQIPHKDKEAVRRRIIKAVRRHESTGEDVLECYKQITNRYKSIKWGKIEELTKETAELSPEVAPPANTDESPLQAVSNINMELMAKPNINLINAVSAIKYLNMMNLYNRLDPSIRPANPEDVLNDEKYIKMLAENQEIVDKERLTQQLTQTMDEFIPDYVVDSDYKLPEDKEASKEILKDVGLSRMEIDNIESAATEAIPQQAILHTKDFKYDDMEASPNYTVFKNIRDGYLNNDIHNILSFTPAIELIALIPYALNKKDEEILANALKDKINPVNGKRTAQYKIIGENQTNKLLPVGDHTQLYNSAVTFINHVLGTDYKLAPIKGNESKLAYRQSADNPKYYTLKFKTDTPYFKDGGPSYTQHITPNTPTDKNDNIIMIPLNAMPHINFKDPRKK